MVEGGAKVKDKMKFLVPVDGSLHSKKALEMAVKLAEPVGAHIDILFVSYFERETDGDPDHPSWLPLSVMAKGVSSAEEVLEEARKELPAGLDVESHVVVGMPSRKIVEFAAANGHDLIIMGGRGLSPVTGFLLGSVSQEVMEEAKCAVLVAK